MQNNNSPLNDEVRKYWEKEPCGTSEAITGTAEMHSLAWYEAVEAFRYRMEPFIHSAAQFTRYHGKKISGGMKKHITATMAQQLYHLIKMA